MKPFIVAVLFLVPAFAQPGIPIFAGPTINFLPPAVDATGNLVAFGSSVTSEGNVQSTIDLYAGGVNLAPNVTSAGLTRDGSQAVFAEMVSGGEGVGIVDLSTGAVRRLNVDTQGCIRPLALCVNCFFACVATPHATADGSKVLYAVRRNQPFYVVNKDGTGLTQLPVYSGVLAPSPQRVISGNGRVVFTSSAPFGPTFAAAATDVYLMNLDGTAVRNLTNFGNSAIFASNATISADGATIVFETNFAGPGSAPGTESQIWAVQSDGSRLRQLTFGPGAGTNASISGDGMTGVFLRDGRINLLEPLADAPSRTPKTVAQLRYSALQSPVISEDGQRLTFLIGPDSFSAGAVYQANADGSGLHAIHAPRAISPRGVVSAAGFSLAPSLGGLVSVYGINLSGDSITNAVGFPLPTGLGGASVLVNGRQLPMLSVSPWQIVAQVPPEFAAPSSNFQVSYPGLVTPPEAAEIATASPALFASQVQSSGATIYQAAAFHAGTAIAADDSHPAKAGEVLELYGTGIGATDPVVPAGLASPNNPAARAKVQPRVLIGNVEARVLFAGLTPGLAGVAQVNIVVPDGLRPGRYGVALQIGQGTTGAVGSIAVQ
jgi:uncharacterized protein (TIGR03437 family)